MCLVLVRITYGMYACFLEEVNNETRIQNINCDMWYGLLKKVYLGSSGIVSIRRELWNSIK